MVVAIASGGVTVQPTALLEPSASLTNVAVAGTGTLGNSETWFTYPKLTH